MSVLIKGIDMPKNCAECPCRSNTEWGDDYCQAILGEPDIEDSYSGRLDNCPLVAVPAPHGDLIDRDVVLPELKDELSGEGVMWRVSRTIHNAPTIIDAEDGK